MSKFLFVDIIRLTPPLKKNLDKVKTPCYHTAKRGVQKNWVDWHTTVPKITCLAVRQGRE